eukprot:1101799-Amphidinium_carterae.1
MQVDAALKARGGQAAAKKTLKKGRGTARAYTWFTPELKAARQQLSKAFAVASAPEASEAEVRAVSTHREGYQRRLLHAKTTAWCEQCTSLSNDATAAYGLMKGMLGRRPKPSLRALRTTQGELYTDADRAKALLQHF